MEISRVRKASKKSDAVPPETPSETKSTTNQAILDIERILDNKPVLVYVQDMAIDPWDVIPIFSLLSEIGKVDTLNIIIDCGGGYADDAFKIANVLHEFCEHLVVIVPFKAKSAATVLSLAGDKILMSPLAELGPCDPMIDVEEALVTPTGLPQRVPDQEDEGSPKKRTKKRQINALALRDFLEAAGILQRNQEGDIVGYDCGKLMPFCEKGVLNPWLLGDFERSFKQSRQWSEVLMTRYMFKDDAERNEIASRIGKRLTEGYYHHGYPISRREARDLGLKVEDMENGLWKTVSALMARYDEIKKEGNLRTIIETSRSIRSEKWQS